MRTFKLMMATIGVMLFTFTALIWILSFIEVIKLPKDGTLGAWMFMMFFYFVMVKPVSKSFGKENEERLIEAKKTQTKNWDVIGERRKELIEYMEENAYYKTYANGKEYVVFDDNDEEDVALFRALADFVSMKYKMTGMKTFDFDFPDLHPDFIHELNKKYTNMSSLTR